MVRWFLCWECLRVETQGLLPVFPATLCFTGGQAGQGEGEEGLLPSWANLFCLENSFPGSTWKADGAVRGNARQSGSLGQTPEAARLIELRSSDQEERAETPGLNTGLSSLSPASTFGHFRGPSLCMTNPPLLRARAARWRHLSFSASCCRGSQAEDSAGTLDRLWTDGGTEKTRGIWRAQGQGSPLPDTARAVASGSLTSWENPGVAGLGCCGPGTSRQPWEALAAGGFRGAACGAEGLQLESNEAGTLSQVE